MAKSALLLCVALIALLSLLPTASADWSGDAGIKTASVHINSMERFVVVVRNDGAAPIEVISVAVTINWDNMPTLYRVFEGSAIIAPGESKEFSSAPTRMPNVDLRTYQCFAGVVAKGPDGVAIEHRYPSTITATQLTLSPPGVPEELFFPLLLTSISAAVTLLLFRPERMGVWPFVRMSPRWGCHQ